MNASRPQRPDNASITSATGAGGTHPAAQVSRCMLPPGEGPSLIAPAGPL